MDDELRALLENTASTLDRVPQTDPPTFGAQRHSAALRSFIVSGDVHLVDTAVKAAVTAHAAALNDAFRTFDIPGVLHHANAIIGALPGDPFSLPPPPPPPPPPRRF